MTKREVLDHQDKFGLIYINGSIYTKHIHGFIREANSKDVRIERLEGVDLFVKFKDVVSIKVKKAPVLTE